MRDRRPETAKRMQDSGYKHFSKQNEHFFGGYSRCMQRIFVMGGVATRN